MKGFIRRPSPAMFVALAALTVAVGGTAAAATKLVNGDKLIKKHSVSGNRLRSHTLTGTQINLKKLGKVPSASKADAATNATTASTASNALLLGGHKASDFTAKQDSGTITATASGGSGTTVPVPTPGPVTYSERCKDNGGGSFTVTLLYQSSVSGVLEAPPVSTPGAFLTVSSTATAEGVWTASTNSGFVSHTVDLYPDGSAHPVDLILGVHIGSANCLVRVITLT